MADRMCATCGYWTRTRVEGPGVPGIPGSPAMGSCRRYAPHPTVGTGHAHVIWPLTAAAEYCGEWEAAAGAAVPVNAQVAVG